MPSYRIETALSNRAVCSQTECKSAGIKIDKNELRFGVWVEFQDRGSFRWKHWGCVTGKQLQNMRANLDPQGTGNYEWDRLDGYDDEGKGGLVHVPDLQEKVRRVVTQGFIDPEDFNGDPEMNKLGEEGIRTAATKKRMREEKKARAMEDAEAENRSAPIDQDRDTSTGAVKKRARNGDGSDKEEDDSKPAPKKKRATKAKKEEDEDIKPKTPSKKNRKTAVKEDIDDLDTMHEDKPKVVTKKSRKKAVKDEPVGEDMNDLDEVKAVPKKSRKKAVKEEPIDQTDVDGTLQAKAKAAPKKPRSQATKKDQAEVGLQTGADEAEVKAEPVEMPETLSVIEPVIKEGVEVEKPQLKKKGGRSKSLNSAVESKKSGSTRISRSRNASKN